MGRNESRAVPGGGAGPACGRLARHAAAAGARTAGESPMAPGAPSPAPFGRDLSRGRGNKITSPSGEVARLRAGEGALPQRRATPVPVANERFRKRTRRRKTAVRISGPRHTRRPGIAIGGMPTLQGGGAGATPVSAVANGASGRKVLTDQRVGAQRDGCGRVAPVAHRMQGSRVGADGGSPPSLIRPRGRRDANPPECRRRPDSGTPGNTHLSVRAPHHCV